MNDIVLSKISNIKNCLKRIKDTTNLDPKSIENNFDKQDIFVLNLQRAIQASFDITNNIIKEYNLDLPVNYKSGFEILSKHNFIDKNIKEKMIKMDNSKYIIYKQLMWDYNISPEEVNKLIKGEAEYAFLFNGRNCDRTFLFESQI